MTGRVFIKFEVGIFPKVENGSLINRSISQKSKTAGFQVKTTSKSQKQQVSKSKRPQKSIIMVKKG